MPCESWSDLVSMLTEAQQFLEAAVDGLHDISTSEFTGEMHAARLLGLVTDAWLLALWIHHEGSQ
jgi:hypothetical protein